jgi:uncharacterized membrane protein
MDTDSPLQRSKQPRSILAGPYGHPLHPILVTIPIGTWIASLIFDVVAIVNAGDRHSFLLGAQVLIGIGIIGALLAALFGFLDLSILDKGTAARRTALTHMSLNLAIVVVFVINFIVRAASGFKEVSVAGLILTIVALLALLVSGWLGGKLAYHFGVRVADERTQAEGFR